jgi:hypothetical protein
MELQKAYIQILNSSGDEATERIEVMFNPSEYTLEKSNQFQSTPILGLSTPLTQFVSGNTQSLIMDLFFDSYEKRENVNIYTDKVLSLLSIDKELHAPPQCKFIWGHFHFKAIVEVITRKFTMFLNDGTPVRATLNVTFKEYKTLSEQINNPPLHSSDRTKMRTLKESDSMWLIADREYGDPGEWRRIAEANDIENPRTVEAGRELKLPPVE